MFKEEIERLKSLKEKEGSFIRALSEVRKSLIEQSILAKIEPVKSISDIPLLFSRLKKLYCREIKTVNEKELDDFRGKIYSFSKGEELLEYRLENERILSSDFRNGILIERDGKKVYWKTMLPYSQNVVESRDFSDMEQLREVIPYNLPISSCRIYQRFFRRGSRHFWSINAFTGEEKRFETVGTMDDEHPEDFRGFYHLDGDIFCLDRQYVNKKNIPRQCFEIYSANIGHNSDGMVQHLSLLQHVIPEFGLQSRIFKGGSFLFLAMPDKLSIYQWGHHQKWNCYYKLRKEIEHKEILTLDFGSGCYRHEKPLSSKPEHYFFLAYPGGVYEYIINEDVEDVDKNKLNKVYEIDGSYETEYDKVKRVFLFKRNGAVSHIFVPFKGFKKVSNEDGLSAESIINEHTYIEYILGDKGLEVYLGEIENPKNKRHISTFDNVFYYEKEESRVIGDSIFSIVYTTTGIRLKVISLSGNLLGDYNFESDVYDTPHEIDIDPTLNWLWLIYRDYRGSSLIRKIRCISLGHAKEIERSN